MTTEKQGRSSLYEAPVLSRGAKGREDGGRFSDSCTLTSGTGVSRYRSKMTRTNRVKSVDSAAQKLNDFHSEIAFLSDEVRNYLNDASGSRKSRSINKTKFTIDQGVVLFADISGFTALGKRLKSELSEKKAAEEFAKQIIMALKTLTDVCLKWGGDVSKFAGDALLCVWKSADPTQIIHNLKLARSCAYWMFKGLKKVNKDLDLHGGIGSGTLINYHLYNKQKNGGRDMRWHLIAGEACSEANRLLDLSSKGAVLFINPVYASIREKIAQGFERPLGNVTEILEVTEASDVMTSSLFVDTHPALKKSVEQWGNILDWKVVNTYLPRQLAPKLSGGGMKGGESLNVAVMFVAIPEGILESTRNFRKDSQSRVLSKNGGRMNSRQASQVLSLVNSGRDKDIEKTLKSLNFLFNYMACKVQECQGEVRDLLFDDKGCMFIGVFGAHEYHQDVEDKAIRCAKKMLNCHSNRYRSTISRLKIGISSGPCFAGMCGNDQRHDFVVMGHEVNVAARLCNGASEGEILVSPSVHAKTKSSFEFSPNVIYKKKKHKPKEEKRKTEASAFSASVVVEPTSAKLPFPKKSKSHNNGRESVDSKDSLKRNSTFRSLPVRGTNAPGSTVFKLSPKKSDKRATEKYNCFLVRGEISASTSTRASRSVFSNANKSLKLDETFVGRVKILKRMEKLVSKPNGAIISIRGEQGVGKSSLVRHFRAKIKSTHDIAFCAGLEIEAHTPLFLLQQLVCTLLEEDDQKLFALMAFRKACEKIEALCKNLEVEVFQTILNLLFHSRSNDHQAPIPLRSASMKLSFHKTNGSMRSRKNTTLSAENSVPNMKDFFDRSRRKNSRLSKGSVEQEAFLQLEDEDIVVLDKFIRQLITKTVEKSEKQHLIIFLEDLHYVDTDSMLQLYELFTTSISGVTYIVTRTVKDSIHQNNLADLENFEKNLSDFMAKLPSNPSLPNESTQPGILDSPDISRWHQLGRDPPPLATPSSEAPVPNVLSEILLESLTQRETNDLAKKLLVKLCFPVEVPDQLKALRYGSEERRGRGPKIKLSTDLSKTLWTKTNGKPQFLLMFLRTYVDQGDVHWSPNDKSFRFKSTNKAEAMALLPKSVIELATLRLNCLDGMQKLVIKVAACIGKKFESHSLWSVLQKDKVRFNHEEFKEILKIIENRGFIEPVKNQRFSILRRRERVTKSPMFNLNLRKRKSRKGGHRALGFTAGRRRRSLDSVAAKKLASEYEFTSTAYFEAVLNLVPASRQEQLTEFLNDLTQGHQSSMSLTQVVQKESKFKTTNLNKGRRLEV